MRMSHNIGLWQVSITLLQFYPEDGGSTFAHNGGTYQITWCHTHSNLDHQCDYGCLHKK